MEDEEVEEHDDADADADAGHKIIVEAVDSLE